MYWTFELIFFDRRINLIEVCLKSKGVWLRDWVTRSPIELSDSDENYENAEPVMKLALRFLILKLGLSLLKGRRHGSNRRFGRKDKSFIFQSWGTQWKNVECDNHMKRNTIIWIRTWIVFKTHTLHEDILIILNTSFCISNFIVLFLLLCHPSLSKIDFEVLARNQCILMLHFSNLKFSRWF